ncbi:MAG: hypothetical protein AB9842_01280 [Bacteroidales bacterium]
MINNRLLSIDVIRGYAIATILVIHRIHYQWTGMESREVLRANIHGPWAPLIILTIAMFTMAGIFYFISGLVNAYSIYSRVSKDSCNRSKWMIGGVISGFILIIFNYLHRLFFMNGFIAIPGQQEPEFPIGILTGLVRDSHSVNFTWSQVTEPGTLSLIGLILIVISLFMGLLLKNKDSFLFRNARTILTVTAIFFLLATPFMKYWLRPVYECAYQQEDYLTASCIGYICQEFCLFPYLGYGFAGAVLGISLARKEDKKKFFRLTRLWIIVLLTVGIAGLLIFEREDMLGKRILGACVSYIELALFIIFLNLLLHRLDFSKENKYRQRWVRTLGIRRIGMVALSVYFFEPVVAEILKNGVDIIVGNTSWTRHFYWVLLFGLGCLSVWWMIIRYWAKVNFAGSLEWMTAWLLLRLAGKRSTKTDLSSIKDSGGERGAASLDPMGETQLMP